MAEKITVLGAGIAGIAAALFARKSGADVLVVSDDFGTTALSSGSFVFRGTVESENSLYADAKQVITELLPNWHMLDEPQMLPNVHGTTTPIVVAAPWHKNALLKQHSGTTVLLVGLYECVQFWAEFAAKGLAALFAPDIDFVGVRLEPFGIENPNPVAVAKWFDSSKHREALAEVVLKLAKIHNAKVVLLPPVIGTTVESFNEFSNALKGVKVAELWATWGAGGLRTLAVARKQAENAGVKFYKGRIIGVERKDGAIVAVLTKTERLPIEGKVILAIGGTLLAAKDIGVEHFRPPVDLPWGMSEDTWILRDPNRLFAQQIDSYHPALSIGVSVDDKLRVLTEYGEVWAENCFACGDTLSGAYPARGGLAFAVSSAVAAAKSALQQG